MARKLLYNGLLFLLTLLAVGTGCLRIQAAEEASAAPLEGDVPQEEEQDWVDSSHDYVADGANRLVQWMDDFYGTELSDIETASSRIRLRFGYEYDELKKEDFKVRLRGKVQLPKLSKRVALVMEGEEGDADRAGPGSDDDNGQVGLQYKFGESGRNRFDGILSVNASADLRLGVRFRHDGEYSDSLTGRFVQDVAHQTGDKGWFSRTRADGYRRLDDDNLLAWINRVEYGEDTYGVEWRTSLQWRHRLTESSAITYLAGLDGVTDPDPLTENYGFAVIYRTSIYRDYLFAEIQPAYMWRKEADFQSREGVYAINLRFEIHFEKKPKKKKKGSQQIEVPEGTSEGEPLAWSGAVNSRRSSAVHAGM